MKILFTKKKLNQKLIAEKLGENFTYDFVDVIRIKQQTVEPFDLKDRSLIFTSINGVEGFFENGFRPNENFLDRNYNKIYCVGQKTKKKIREYGFGTFKVKKHAQDLAEFITENSTGEKFIHFCGNLALDVLNKSLPLQNISYRKVVVYETELLYPKITEDVEAVAFFSPSGIRSYVAKNILDGKILFSMGNTTTKELKKFTKNKIITSKESSFEDLLNLISSNLKPDNKTDDLI